MENTQSSDEETGLPRFSRGKRPDFYQVEGVDEAMSMILTLASEFTIMRDRMETIELLLAKNGQLTSLDVDNFEADAELLSKRDERRQDFLERLYYLTLKRAHEQASSETEKGYFDKLNEIAER